MTTSILKTKFLPLPPVYSWDQHYDFSVTLAILILLVFSMQHFLLLTIDKTRTARLVTSTRVVSYVG